MVEFNDLATPKIGTERFKIYLDVGDGNAPEWELQGRGIESWTIEENSDVDKKTDVLKLVDMERKTPQPTQSGIAINLRKESKLASLLFEAWVKRDYSKLNALKILQKFEFVDGNDPDTCLARLEEDVMIAINTFNGEAGGSLGFEIDIHYANKTTTGTMAKKDGATIEFIPDSAV